MYGKIFSSMYEGSMIGAGATVFALMGYVISRQQPPDFNVELNAKLISAILGEPEGEVIKAIEYLCAPDPISRSEKEDGRRLIKVGAFTYHVVNGEDYHAIRNYEERKAYNRDKQAEYRAKKNLPEKTQPQPKQSVTKIPSILNTKEFLEAWSKWLEHLKQKRKSPSEHTKELQLKKLESFGVNRAVTALLHSIEKGWQGIFEPNTNNGHFESSSSFKGVTDEELTRQAQL